MSFLDDPDDLAAVASEWGKRPETLLAVAALVQAAIGDGCDTHDEYIRWIVDRGYATLIGTPERPGIHLTEAGYLRAAGLPLA